MSDLHLRRKFVRGRGRRGKESSWMKVWPSLHQTGPLSPNPHIGMARRSWGGMLSAAHVIPVCSQFAPPSPLLHGQGLGWLGFSRSPPCLYSASPSQLWIYLIFLSLPRSLYLMFIFLHRFCILFICLAFHLISPILKGLSGEERASPASPSSIYQIRPGVRFYLRKGR